MGQTCFGKSDGNDDQSSGVTGVVLVQTRVGRVVYGTAEEMTAKQQITAFANSRSPDRCHKESLKSLSFRCGRGHDE